LWNPCSLTFEGKFLIIKNFCLSQLIYNIKYIKVKEKCIKKREQNGFLLVSSKSESDKGMHRIKKFTLKNDIAKGELNTTDVECNNISKHLFHTFLLIIN
jgi:hypothetical protein